MKLKSIVESLRLKVLTAPEKLDEEVSGGYASDLLSDVMAHSKEKNIWITLQTHQNIVAVAKLKDIAAVLIVNDRRPDPETAAKAEAEKVPLLLTELSAFEIAGRLYSLLRKKD
jgi:hypothetical protein